MTPTPPSPNCEPGRTFGRAAVTVAALACALGASACRLPDLRQTVSLRVAGAQVPVGLVTNWLEDAPGARFEILPVPPLRYSGDGFDALILDDCDIACTDRAIEPRERAALEESGADPAGYRLGYYGYGLYVNRDNTLDSIFAGDLLRICRRQITNWRQLGGPDLELTLYGPAKRTRGGRVLSSYANIFVADATWTVCDTVGQIVRRVAEDPGGLGFAPIGYDFETRYLGVRAERDGPVRWPTVEAIESDGYPLAKVIFVYARQPLSAPAAAAIDYLLSPRATEAMSRTHVRRVPVERARLDGQP